MLKALAFRRLFRQLGHLLPFLRRLAAHCRQPSAKALRKGNHFLLEGRLLIFGLLLLQHLFQRKLVFLLLRFLCALFQALGLAGCNGNPVFRSLRTALPVILLRGRPLLSRSVAAAGLRTCSLLRRLAGLCRRLALGRYFRGLQVIVLPKGLCAAIGMVLFITRFLS